MKSTNLRWVLFLLLPLSLRSTPDISMELYRFRTESISYIEISMYVVGSSLMCKDLSGLPYGVEYILLVKDSSGQIMAGNRYKLSSVGCPAKDIMDVKRYTLPPGRYIVEIEAMDLQDSLNIISINEELEIEAMETYGTLSDIQLCSIIKSQQEAGSPLNKSGMYMEPLPFNFYYPSLDQLFVYIETYNAHILEGQPYLQYTIRSAKGDLPAPIVTYKKVKKEAVAASILQLDISALITGPYSLEAALYDGNKQIKSIRKVAFSRLNPEGDSLFMESAAFDVELGFAKDIPDDSLDYYVRAMAPIVQSMEVEIMNTLLKKGSPKVLRYFIHRYWTAEAGKLAGPAFYGYMKIARVVDDNYKSGFGYGFESDRGHIFLKYGKPDEVIEVEDEPSAPPYEIWFYNLFPETHQTNVRFLFYNPSLSKGAFKLLHSTAIGEVRNERWEIELYRDATLEVPGVNETVMGDNVYRNARKYFEY